jgi:site-specific DNA-cytosine methylase
MKPLRHIGLFEGIGGFSLAGHWAGWQTIAWCEWAAFPSKVLKYHFPNADQLTDITNADFTIYRGQCDVLTGGFPCQPFSVAGSRKGADDHRYLWPHMLRAVQECRPTWVVGENVAGITSMAFEPRVTSVGGQTDIEGQTLHEDVEELGVLDSICANLEREGYDVQTFIIPAAAANAPHRRDRAWIVAHSNKCGHKANGGTQTKANGIQSTNGQAMGAGQFDGASISRTDTNPESGGRGKLPNESQTPRPCQSREPLECLCGMAVCRWNATNANGERFEECNASTKPSKPSQQHNKTNNGTRLQRWQNFPTQPPICGGNDGISDELDISALFEEKKAISKTAQNAYTHWRNESIKAYGNAIVPQVFFEIAKAINQAHQCD